jgi:hypothetical protein
VVANHDSKVLARTTFRCRAPASPTATASATLLTVDPATRWCGAARPSPLPGSRSRPFVVLATVCPGRGADRPMLRRFRRVRWLTTAVATLVGAAFAFAQRQQLQVFHHGAGQQQATDIAAQVARDRPGADLPPMRGRVLGADRRRRRERSRPSPSVVGEPPVVDARPDPPLPASLVDGAAFVSLVREHVVDPPASGS